MPECPSPQPHEPTPDRLPLRDRLSPDVLIYLGRLRDELHGIAKRYGVDVRDIGPMIEHGKVLMADVDRLAELVREFQRAARENALPMDELQRRREAVERLFDLESQHGSQVALLRKLGLVETRQQSLFLLGIDGREYPLPSHEAVLSSFAERMELLKEKADQGFTKLLLVPFGMSLRQLVERTDAFIRSKKGGSPERPKVFIEDKHLMGDVAGNLVYNPTSFHPVTHGGRTKMQILTAQREAGNRLAGWQVLLVRPAVRGRGIAMIMNKIWVGGETGKNHPRPDVRTGSSPIEYLANQNATTGVYQGEFGMNLEDWLVAFMTHLEETDKYLDGHDNDGGSYGFLTGTFFPEIGTMTPLGEVPYVYWGHEDQWVEIGPFAPDEYIDEIGVRSAVNIGLL